LKRVTRNVPAAVSKTSFCARRAFQIATRKILSLRSPYRSQGAFHVRRCNPGRQVRAGKRAGLSDRHPGPGAAADDAAPARPGRRPQYRRLHFRLPRFATGRFRPGAVAGQALHQEEPYRVPARHQRRPGRDGAVGHPADPPLSRRPVRRRVRHVVRQGSGRRPIRRRAEARQLRRHLQAWRHPGAGRRRPHGQVVDHGAPER
jgi:hypothetical protein